MIVDAHPPRYTRVVGIIGYGAIGAVLAGELQRGQPGLELGGVVASRAPDDLRFAGVDSLTERCDVIVEAAGQAAVEAYGERILSTGCDLLLLSVGALAADSFARRLAKIDGGRLMLSTGALGGVDLLRAAALSGGLANVEVVTRKPAGALITDGSPVEARRTVASGRPATIFHGTARQVATEFPSSTNVAATVGLCTLGLDNVNVELIADPQARRVSHRVTAEGGIGHYAFDITNHPSKNPRTSAITPFAALRALLDDCGRIVIR